MLQGFLIRLLKMMKKRISWSSCQVEEMNHTKISTKEEENWLFTQNAEELRVVYKEYSGREQFYYLNSNREERLLTDCQRATNLRIVIYQANKGLLL